MEPNSKFEETAYIYPNPTTGIFYIDFEYEGLEVIKATKAQILLTFLKGEANDLSSLDQGVYFVRVQGGNYHGTVKRLILN